MKFKTEKLGDFLYVKGRIGWKGLKKDEYLSDGVYRIINGEALTKDGIDWSKAGFISKERYEESPEIMLQNDDILISKDGTIGKLGFVRNLENPSTVASGIFVLRNLKPEMINIRFIYNYLSSVYFRNYIISRTEGSVIPHLYQKDFVDLYFPLPSLKEQNKIVDVLDTISCKIEINKMINNNLLEQVLTLYRNRFIDTINNKRRIFRADKYFDISIGKTPPRKEPQWFSTNPQDITWVSISDMGTCGLYISSSSEQLTREAVERHNVKIVPDNTILLSFKLTVGRIAITNGEMTTNEAIAHFKTDKKEINEYLYCYLKCFNYQTMGSTSSIATAVNSKIIKGMPFVVPTDDELIDFHSVAAPIFAKIKASQTESKNLTAVRDILLPKLMSGELDVSNIDI
ncbi:restriction endonuclease subunit S [Lachnoanaerobaculum umeaense]|uniref:Restriction endonuclease subunit S n=1 Tax=Lachnoanaerobaculum umeaense TaxID=617123 RepID=A0A385PYG1_9FIRM|nr:restriction endonuclease subunit S [Lachnoanaerobaculum umeaense]AYA99198.1 restriction endonuclease subunit S [Lachnoanaerobaculum umeaense]PZW93366.1 type I restriction enzyme S subunit [Lachnoanaerobaculum umeaense]